jgi:cytochrome oxidase Cu insertion factor (SCO1/SenC/PrrC family)
VGSPSVGSEFHTALLRQGALIFLVLVVLFAAWNGLRSLQYRRSVAHGESVVRPPPHQGSEPTARRFLRTGFGALWIVDGLLQLQSGMPLGLPGGVLEPSAATSPGWVRAVVGVASSTWSHHPASAAAGIVWIQLGIGILLVVAPRGRWSQLAGVTSAGWGLMVWVFGEAFGGLFAPGMTLLSGAPGGVLFYVVAGALVALPERAWSSRKLGQIATGSTGLLLLVMAGLQAWPGRGFWQGRVSGHPGTLAGIVHQTATESQPHALARLVAAFGSFDQAHGWLVNLVAGVVIAATGAALVVGGRWLRPGVVLLVGFSLLDWILVEDMGVWGGTGTDPNSMVPLALFVVGGYLALSRMPATAGEPIRTEPTARETTSWRTRWSGVNPGYAAQLVAAVGASVIVLIGAAPMVAAAANAQADPTLTESVNGPPNPADGVAPAFTLTDQYERPVSLHDLRGSVVVLTFLDPVCTTDCPLIAQELRVTNQMLGPTSSRVRFVAVVANPNYHSVAAVDSFDRQEGLDSQSNWLFLTGSLPALRSVWNSYGEGVFSAPAGGMAAHSDLVYLIDRAGITRQALDADPGDGLADHESFSTLLTDQIDQVIHE